MVSFLSWDVVTVGGVGGALRVVAPNANDFAAVLLDGCGGRGAAEGAAEAGG